MKKDKSFESLVNKMEQLKETEQGKLKGGIAVVSSLSIELDENSGTCVNNGDCSGEDNTGSCTNYCNKK